VLKYPRTWGEGDKVEEVCHVAWGYTVSCGWKASSFLLLANILGVWNAAMDKSKRDQQKKVKLESNQKETINSPKVHQTNRY
jgi:hypothetical protein